LAALAGLLLAPAGLLAQKDRYVLVGVDKGGYRVFEKVIVTDWSAELVTELGEEGGKLVPKKKESKKVPFLSIFFKLRPVPKQPDDLVRVGTCEGTQLGWIDRKRLADWNTRFVLDPIEPLPDRTFEVDLGGKKTARLKARPPGHRSYAFVLARPAQRKDEDESDYQVLVSTGPQGGSTGGVETVEAAETKLEVVFVLESSDFMKKKFKGDDKKPLLGYLQDLVREVVEEVQKDRQLAGAVRLGFVQYWDDVPWKENDKRLELPAGTEAQKKRDAELLRKFSPLFPASLTCDLTDDVAAFRKGVEGIVAVSLHDDWPDDVLSGLKLAVEKARWSKNSVKHVILVGSASFHLGPEGAKANQYDDVPENSLTRTDERLPRGFNSTGLTIEGLIDRAQPAGGGTARALSSKYFHALFLPNEQTDLKKALPGLDDAKLARLRELTRALIRARDEEAVKKLTKQLSAEGLTAQQFAAAKRAYLVEHQAELARSHYEQLCRARGGGSGLFRRVEPTAADVTRASRELVKRLIGSFEDLKKLRRGETVSAPKDNPLALPVWQLSEALREDDLKRQPTVRGSARVRNKDGREVASRKILVSRLEMRRLDGVLKDVHARFAKLGDDRKDLKRLLADLQESLGKAGLGQLEVKSDRLADESLERLLGDLPMRSRALKMRMKDLADMDADTFARWLKMIDDAARRCRRLYEDPSQWSQLTKGAVPGDDQYGFFVLSTLP
jgi:hypothetical protein